MVAGGSEWFRCLAVVRGGSWWFVVVAGSVRWCGVWWWLAMVPGGCC